MSTIETERPSPEVISLLTDERRTALANQVSFTDTIRNRTTALLSVASIVSAIFGTNIALTGSHPRPVLASLSVALAAFVASVLLAIENMRLRNVQVGVDVDSLLAYAWERPTTAEGMSNTLAKRYGEAYEANRTVVESLDKRYEWICFLVAVQVIAWALTALKI